MIIQCKKCDTKFRFDDNLMAGDGVWVRCSRCQQVFFQDNPAHEQGGPTQAAGDSSGEIDVQRDREGEDSEGVLRDSDSTGNRIGEKEAEPIIAWEREVREIMKEENQAAPLLDPGLVQEAAADRDKEPAKVQTRARGTRERKKGVLGKVIAYLVLVLLIVMFLGGLYLLAFPEDRQEIIDTLAMRFPFFERLSSDQRLPGRFASQVMLQDVRQRMVNNLLTGNIRVVEGTAVNGAKYPLTRIQVKGRLYDRGGVIVGEQGSFCGNLLTDAEIATLTEEEIQKKLSQPMGSNIPMDRIKPNDQIPFIIVFFHEPPTVAKVTVIPAGAERLLE